MLLYTGIIRFRAAKIRIHVFIDRIEIINPGGLPNTITPEKMLYGSKYHRNPFLVQYLYDAGIVEPPGQGIPKTNKWMKENGNLPLRIVVDEHEVKVVMYRGV